MKPQTTFATAAPLWHPQYISALASDTPPPNNYGNKRALSDADILEIRAGYNTGVTTTSMAARYQVSASTIIRMVRAGYSTTGRSTATTRKAYTTLAPHIMDCLREGQPVRTIARNYAVSCYAVRCVRERMDKPEQEQKL